MSRGVPDILSPLYIRSVNPGRILYFAIVQSWKPVDEVIRNLFDWKTVKRI